MKTLFLLIAITLVSCGVGAPKRNFVVTKIKTTTEAGICEYVMNGTATPLRRNATIIDSCGKFNIGDTIKFTK